MFIKEFIKCKLTDNRFYDVLYPGNMEDIDFVAIFFDDAFRHIYRYGAMEFVEKLKTNNRSGMSSEMISLDMDNEHNLAYISEPYDNSQKEITPEIQLLINNESTIELCHKNFIGYVVMGQENLFYLLLKWAELRDRKVPFILLYLDDKNWYDSLSFETHEAMDQFVADHLQK
jgi:hypothetical protein